MDNQHHPIDVIGGAFIGLLVASAVFLRIATKVAHKTLGGALPEFTLGKPGAEAKAAERTVAQQTAAVPAPAPHLSSTINPVSDPLLSVGV